MAALHWVNLRSCPLLHTYDWLERSQCSDTLICFDLENYWAPLPQDPPLHWAHLKEAMPNARIYEAQDSRIHLTPSWVSFALGGINCFGEKPGFLCCPWQLCGPPELSSPSRPPCSCRAPACLGVQQEAGPAQMFVPLWGCTQHERYGHCSGHQACWEGQGTPPPGLRLTSSTWAQQIMCIMERRFILWAWHPYSYGLLSKQMGQCN